MVCQPPLASESFITAIDHLFAQALAKKTFSGASLLVATPDAMLFHQTWGRTRHRGRPVDSHTLFDLASLTKPLITTPLCLRAIADDKFSLDTTIRRYFPELLIGTEKKTISVRHLLNHCSGLPAYRPFYQRLIAIAPADRETALGTMVLRTPLDSRPGTVSCYSDLGFMLLPILLERAYKKPFGRLATEILLQPLHLSLTRPKVGGSPKLSFQDPERVSKGNSLRVIPAEVGGQESAKDLLSGFRRNDTERSLGPCSIHPQHCSTMATLGFRSLGVPPDPTLTPKKAPAPGRIFAATESCPWRQRLLIGEVHDEHAYCLGGVAPHAGLFGTAHGVYRLLMFLWDLYSGRMTHPSWPAEVVREFWTKPSIVPGSTWLLGFDSPSAQHSSAGDYFSPHSIGHLGFTGTSFWFDLDREILVILLTNRVHPSRENERLKSFRPVLHNLVMETCHGRTRP